jgi:hypothetical protein
MWILQHLIGIITVIFKIKKHSIQIFKESEKDQILIYAKRSHRQNLATRVVGISARVGADTMMKREDYQEMMWTHRRTIEEHSTRHGLERFCSMFHLRSMPLQPPKENTCSLPPVLCLSIARV